MNPFSGRLGRKGFLLWSLTTLIIGGVFAVLIDMTKHEHRGTYWLGPRIIIVTVMIGLYLYSVIHRLEDIKQSPFWAILTLVPIVSLFFWLFLVLSPSKYKTPKQP